jgi:hypothetical protein
LAPREAATAFIRSIACSRASAMSFVYSAISPPTRFLRPARMSLPTWRARIVFPYTSPNERTTRLPTIDELGLTIIE